MAAKEGGEETKGVSRETKRRKDGKLGEIQEKFVKAVAPRSRSKGTEKKGKIEISYFSKQELENIYRHIAHKGSSRG